MKKSSLKHIQEVLQKDLSCCVLIACEHPSDGGAMQVELTYQGDPILATYLLQHAQGLIEEEIEQESSREAQVCLVK